MKIAIMSDICANYEALNAVLGHADQIYPDIFVCLGDIIGYGPNPNECITVVMSRCHYVSRSISEMSLFNSYYSSGSSKEYKDSMEWTANKVSDSNRDLLKNICAMHKLNDIYLYGEDGRLSQGHFESDLPVGFYGDSFHVATVKSKVGPGLFREVVRIGGGASHKTYKLEEGVKYLISPGSVGQPRDGDKRASYAIYDSELNEVTFYRVPYSVDITISKMQRHGFNPSSWMRLLYGK